ncbi:hypothetical protein ACROYT_G003551 [Oculina patagonica]
MSRKSKITKDILGVPRRAERQVFVFGRYAEELPSDDSEDSDFNPDSDEERTSTASTSKGTKKKRKSQNDSKKRKFSKKPKPRSASSDDKDATETLRKKRIKKQNDSRKQKFAKILETESCTNNNDDTQGQTRNAATMCKLTRGWSDLIPTELLLLIFQNVLNSSSESSVPFLCRMSKVCRRWREVASEPVLWRKVDLSASSSSSSYFRATTATIEKLAPTRLTAVTELSLLGWLKLTDKAIEAIGKDCHELQSIVLALCGDLTSGGIASLADKCQHLKMIDISFTKIDITGLQHITTVLGSQLEKLCLTNCTRLRGEHILPLIQENCPNLTFLDVSSTNVRSLNIEKLQAGCPKLKELFLVNLLLNSTPVCKTTNNEKKPNGFPQLENLGLPCGFIGNDHRTDKFLYRILWASHNLKVLDIRGPNRFSPEGLRALPATSLEQLYLTNCATFSKVAAVIEKWHHSLKVLDLSINKNVEDEFMELLHNFGMPKLHTLDLNNTNITANGVRSVLNGCPNLTELNLTSCRGVPRGIKQRHQGDLRHLLQKLVVNIDQESDERE